MDALPPLNWIRAFEAAARHESFRRAAGELRVSPGAVSQKVKALESLLGVTLYERHPRGVKLTEKGRQFRDDLCPALDDIAAATRRIAAKAGGERLRIVALPAVAEKWLTPRLPTFRDRRPAIDVEISVAPDITRLARGSFDVAVHYDIAPNPGWDAVPLFRDHMFPVCSPALATQLELREPADLLGCQLLYDTQWAQDWALWFQAAGLPSDSGQRESGFTLYSMAIEAAAEGLGVVIGHESLVARELAGGRLMAPFDVRMPVPHGYAVIVPRWSNGRTDVGEFVDWLTSECADSEKVAGWKKERLADASHDLLT